LGRGHESQVRINDISVSRCHAIIKCKPDGFYVEDNTSKFGTIILLKNKLRLKAHHTMAVQVGRTVISFTIKYVQSERDKLKKELKGVLESKSKPTQPEPAAANYQMMPPGDNVEDVLQDEDEIDAPEEGSMEQN
jgi:pSer/pThr/pTyr-binding forkhead associated (FHA) protein